MRYTWTTDEITSDAGVVARFEQSWLRERAEVDVDGVRMVFRTEGWGGDWVAEHDGDAVVRATPTSFWRTGWTIAAPTGTYEVRRTGFLVQVYEVVAGGAEVGSVRSSSFWSYKPELQAPDAMPAVEVAFVMWLVRRIAARNAAAASA